MNFFPPTLTKKKRIIRSQCESGLCSHLNQVDRKNRLCCCCYYCLFPKVRVAKLTLILKFSLRKTPAELKTCPLLHCQISKSSLSCRPSVIDREVSFSGILKKVSRSRQLQFWGPLPLLVEKLEREKLTEQ